MSIGAAVSTVLIIAGVFLMGFILFVALLMGLMRIADFWGDQ